jgi:hypothetical protein
MGAVAAKKRMALKRRVKIMAIMGSMVSIITGIGYAGIVVKGCCDAG